MRRGDFEKPRIRELRRELLEGLGVPEKAAFVPDDFQLQAIAALKAEHDTLVIAPTGAGKTYIATESIAQCLSEGKRAVYTAPLKALSNAKYTEFKQRFEPAHRVGLLTGDRKIEGDADVIVATTEIYRNELYSFQENYALVVLDELHYLADAQRGPVWEESIILAPQSATLLMLSASISNPKDVADWISEIRGKHVEIIQVRHRPVELRFAFLHPSLGVIPLSDKHGKIIPEVEDFYEAQEDNSNFRYGKRNRRGQGRGRRR